MSGDYEYSSADYATAIAAAAFAVQSLEESKTKDHKGKTYDRDKSLNTSNSKAEQAAEVDPEPRRSSLKFSDHLETPKTSFRDKSTPEKAPSIKKKVSFGDITDMTEKKTKGVPSIARPPSSADKDLDVRNIKKPETSFPRPDPPPMVPQPVGGRVKNAVKNGPGSISRADAWEKSEMVSIKQRYEKMMASIENWRTKKKTKAKRKIERTEAELDRRREKAMQSYRDSVTRIEGIARGARAQAAETRIYEELKVKEKANKIRSTGKVPPTYLCF